MTLKLNSLASSSSTPKRPNADFFSAFDGRNVPVRDGSGSSDRFSNVFCYSKPATDDSYVVKSIAYHDYRLSGNAFIYCRATIDSSILQINYSGVVFNYHNLVFDCSEYSFNQSISIIRNIIPAFGDISGEYGTASIALHPTYRKRIKH